MQVNIFVTLFSMLSSLLLPVGLTPENRGSAEFTGNPQLVKYSWLIWEEQEIGHLLQVRTTAHNQCATLHVLGIGNVTVHFL